MAPSLIKRNQAIIEENLNSFIFRSIRSWHFFTSSWTDSLYIPSRRYSRTNFPRVPIIPTWHGLAKTSIPNSVRMVITSERSLLSHVLANPYWKPSRLVFVDVSKANAHHLSQELNHQATSLTPMRTILESAFPFKNIPLETGRHPWPFRHISISCIGVIYQSPFSLEQFITIQHRKEEKGFGRPSFRIGKAWWNFESGNWATVLE